MDHGTNIDESRRVLEEQIKESEMTTIKLKRTLNSLLGISKLPPEVLGKIFHWNVIYKGEFEGLEKRSHNFLTVCHYWFEVATRTPDLWSFGGNTPKDWSRWHRRSQTAPLDLVLYGRDVHGVSDLNDDLEGAIRDHATKDTIRRVHLTAGDSELLNSIITPLTANSEEVRSNGVESFVLWNSDDTPVDVSDFFAHYRFPKLQRLDLSKCAISSWDHLTSRTSVMTTLGLGFTYPSPAPTTPQLLSILASNPALQKLDLAGLSIPGEGDKSSLRVQLCHLKEFCLNGGSRDVFRLLHQLDYPRNMDMLSLTLQACDVVDISSDHTSETIFNVATGPKTDSTFSPPTAFPLRATAIASHSM